MIAIITEIQKDILVGKQFETDSFFNPIQDLNNNWIISEIEYYNGKAWVAEHFHIIDPEDSDITIEEFLTEVDAIEAQCNIKINTTLCDPFNELRHNFNELAIDGGRQDLYIENRLGFIRKNAQRTGRHNAIITHCTDQAQIKGHATDGSEIWYYPPPNPRQVAGGQAWFRKAMNLISVWRPPVGLATKDGSIFEANEAHIGILKYKPKGTGQRGTVKLYYDSYANRYYEILKGDKRYSGKILI